MSEEPEKAVESPFSGDRAPLPPRVDLITGAVMLVFGLAVLTLAIGMPRFAEQSGTGLTAPGIVPGFYGLVIAGLGLLLALRAVRRGALRPAGPQAPALSGEDARQLGIAAALGIVFAAGLIGRLPFWLAAALFVFAFTTAFEWSAGPVGRLRRVIEAAVIGLVTGVVVTLVFERLFLVRLP